MIIEQLNALSLPEILQVRAKVNALIIKSHFKTADITLINNIDFSKLIEYEIDRISKLKANKDASLEKLIDLVDEWMDDESGYDEESYPQIEAALNQNHPSL